MRFIVEYDINPYSPVWGVAKDADIYDKNTQVLWHPDRANYDTRKGYCIYNMQVKKQINHADSFTFVMPKGHPAYSTFSTFDSRHLLGISVAVRWENSNQCLFFGRVVSISTDIYYQKTVTCEGAFAFLNDILLRPTVFLAEAPNSVEPTPNQNENSSSNESSDTPASQQDPISYDDRTMRWWDYAQYVMRKHSVRMSDIARCHKRSFRFRKHDGSTPISPEDPEYVYLGLTQTYITENRTAGLVYIINPMTGQTSYITPKQYDMVDYIDTSYTPSRYVRFVCDYSQQTPTTLIWRYPTPSEAQPDHEVEDHWSFSEVGTRSQGSSSITDHDKRWTGIDDYMPVMDAINDIIGTDSRYIGFANATIGMGNIDPTDNNVRLFLEVYGPELATKHRTNNMDTVMSLDKNVVDISESGNSFETYTSLIPLDKNKKTLDNEYNKGRKSEYRIVSGTDEKTGDPWQSTSTELDDYSYGQYAGTDEGYIEKTVTFDDIDIDACDKFGYNYGKIALQQRTSEVMKQTSDVSVREFSISMVDLSLLSHVNRETFVSRNEITSGWGDHASDYYLSPNNFIDIGHRVYFECAAYNIQDSDESPWICTSLDMTIDNPAASRYTFAIMNTTYMSSDGMKLSEQADPTKTRTPIASKPTSGTTVDKEAQPTDIRKIDDNHVVEFYPDREVHYVADGTDDTRSNITSFEMPLGTTPLTRGNPEPE